LASTQDPRTQINPFSTSEVRKTLQGVSVADLKKNGTWLGSAARNKFQAKFWDNLLGTRIAKPCLTPARNVSGL